MSDVDEDFIDSKILEAPSIGLLWPAESLNTQCPGVEVDDAGEDGREGNGNRGNARHSQTVLHAEQSLEDEQSPETPLSAPPSHHDARDDQTLPEPMLLHGSDYPSRLDRRDTAAHVWQMIKKETRQTPGKKPDEAYRAAKSELDEATASVDAVKREWNAALERVTDREYHRQRNQVHARYGNPLVGNETQFYTVMFQHDMEQPRPWSYFEHVKFEWKRKRWSASLQPWREEAKKKRDSEKNQGRGEAKRPKKEEFEKRTQATTSAAQEEVTDASHFESSSTAAEGSQGPIARTNPALDSATAAPTFQQAAPAVPKHESKRAKKKAKAKAKAMANSSVKLEEVTQAAKQHNVTKNSKPKRQNNNGVIRASVAPTSEVATTPMKGRSLQHKSGVKLEVNAKTALAAATAPPPRQASKWKKKKAKVNDKRKAEAVAQASKKDVKNGKPSQGHKR
jgi:hypothetical protein